ncbi:gonadotropin-releasing hormone receptor-like [Paramacrobiotus metropolitanus]|uniref:gonadotropin-releasing hormone receptor-like n=1 Tax=Paramacrobiotus metropolitanus TaxID=2943436 RepID=UPI002445D541|nr:gonadotropin-releasing hormone receptor-like [Paramacrobiotus metropolitanus]
MSAPTRNSFNPVYSYIMDNDHRQTDGYLLRSQNLTPADYNTSADGNWTYLILEEDPVEKANRLVQVYVLLSLAVLGFLGNFLIIVVLCTKRLRERHFSNINFLILQLAFSDLLVVAFCLFADAIWKATYTWLAGDLMCKFVKYMQMFSLYASTFIIVTISLDRCIAVLFPISRFDQHRLVKVFVSIAWGFAGICSVPQIIIFSVQKAPFTLSDIEDFYQCVTHGAYSAEWQEPAYVVFTFTIMFAVPLLLIIPNYILICVRITQESRLKAGGAADVPAPPTNANIRNGSGSFSAGHKRELLMKKAKAKALCISVMVIVTFVVCWAPYYVCMIYYVIISKDPSDYMFQIIFFFGMSNSVINPVIYGAFHMAQKSQTAWRKHFGRPRASFALLVNPENCSTARLDPHFVNRTEARLSNASISRRLSSMDGSSSGARRQSSLQIHRPVISNSGISL